MVGYRDSTKHMGLSDRHPKPRLADGQEETPLEASFGDLGAGFPPSRPPTYTRPPPIFPSREKEAPGGGGAFRRGLPGYGSSLHGYQARAFTRSI